MAKAFISGLKGITGQLETNERDLLRNLFADVISLLEPATAESEDPLTAMLGLDMDVSVPTDSALKRLLPDAIKDDADSALEFRQLTERSIRSTKTGALRAAALVLDRQELVLSDDDARYFSSALNDVRLVLAERLNIKDAADAEAIHLVQDWPKAEDVEAYLALVYNFVTWLQESLLQALLEGLGARRRTTGRNA
ncbi:DUF2017 domain-containing protein [Pseudarthrobacter sp. J1738]|uniref:DUF2017 domain-containing protein n=1 Tax=unclassified Pseudarthrobacter TaxID=2647000 RepID=UPI003D2DABC7